MAKKGARRGRKDVTHKNVNLRLPIGLFNIIEREAKKEQRPMQNLIRKLCTEALSARGTFANQVI